ncbi:F0F1 ATP synthase subunit gamma [Paraburkholderia tuberum]|uniref:ATP synthase n=1 Tax=Paraburkholderia tuberum TaxID=157910 RepID=A0A1H1HBJ0_9BURK|nr:F0F1 ATP synthase subunit gamma [Paraburkholderia tuberum]SDR22817.1 ATP synthase [Paraburkholderia tuberum]
MSSKLSEIESRIASARQLDTVIGAMRGIAAARVGAMLAASRHVKDRLQELTRDYRIVRQDEITAEIAEIAELAATGACVPPATSARGQS